MRIISKVGAVLASGVAVALAGCATQQSGAATPANLPNNCAVYAQPASCKGMAHCKHKCYAPEQQKVQSHSAVTTN